MRFRCQIGEGPPLMLTPLPETPMLRRAPPAPPPALALPHAQQRRAPALSRVSAAVLLAAAVGCATPEPKATKAWTIEPLIGVTHAMQAGEAYYQLGRYHDDAQEWGKAALAYRKSIAADARNVEAYNALGVALARTGRHAEAEATLRQAIELAPDRAHVRSNLGLVLLLAGKRADGVAELNTAVTLDAGDTIARTNLRDALAGAEQPAPAAAATAHVAAPATPPSSATVSVPAPITEVELAPATAPAAAPITRQAAVAAAPAPSSAPYLEISNGNGVPGMAAKLGRWLATHQDVRADRLTNQKPFVQRDTVVQYREGHADAAARIARALPIAAQPAHQPSKGLPTEVRVVLGRDWVRSAACLERRGCSAGDAATQVAHAQGAR